MELKKHILAKYMFFSYNILGDIYMAIKSVVIDAGHGR